MVVGLTRDTDDVGDARLTIRARGADGERGQAVSERSDASEVTPAPIVAFAGGAALAAKRALNEKQPRRHLVIAAAHRLSVEGTSHRPSPGGRFA